MHNVAHRTANVCQNQQCTGSSRALLTGFQWIRGIRSRQIALARVIQRDPNDLVSRGPWDIRKNIKGRVCFEDWEREP